MNYIDNKDYSLVYIALCSKLKAPGVFRKINGVVTGAKSCGYSCKSKIIEPDHLNSYFRYIYEIIFAKENYVFIRYINRIGLLIFIAGIILRIRRKKLYIDIPTPMQNHLREIFIHKKITWLNLLDAFLIVAQGVVPFLSATKIIQYAEDSWWFSIGIRRKIIKTGNGIDVSSIPFRDSAPPLEGRDLILVAVGTIAFWHGWDRIINAIGVIKNDSNIRFNIKLNIIGEGPDLERLEQLVLENNLSENVIFTGLLYGNDLYTEYKKSHYGIGSLGWSRIGVSEASPIKVREYLAAGMPVITATKDPDFSGDENFLLTVSADEDIDCIVELLKKIYFKQIPSPQDCRRFAEDQLDYKIKMRLILPAF